MIVTLKPGARIVGFAVDTWQVQRHGPDRHTHTLAEAHSFLAIFAKALAQGVAEPGKPLDLSGFNALVNDAGRRFTLAGASVIRLCEGYTAERIEDDAQTRGRGDAETGINLSPRPALPVSPRLSPWLLIRDTGRGRKHAVQAGEAATIAGILATTVWHHTFRAKREMTIDQVGPYLTGIAQRLLEGATAEALHRKVDVYAL